MNSNHQCRNRLLNGISQFSQAPDLRHVARDLLNLCLGTWLEWPETGSHEFADIG
jgi:hypothetical protein